MRRMSDDPTQIGRPDRERLSRQEVHEWSYELHKLHREFPRATRDEILDALDTAWSQYSQGPMRDKIEAFAAGLLTEWRATRDRSSAHPLPPR